MNLTIMEVLLEQPLIHPQKEAAVTLSSATSICFVCTGNTCRSPMAEALMKSMLFGQGMDSQSGNSILPSKPIHIFSAGLTVFPGDTIAPNAVSALREFGIENTPDNDYEHHLAQPLSFSLIQKADLVVCMTPHHLDMLLNQYPLEKHKFMTMPVAISDPYGGGLTVYMRCLQQIYKGLKSLFFQSDEEQADDHSTD